MINKLCCKKKNEEEDYNNLSHFIIISFVLLLSGKSNQEMKTKQVRASFVVVVVVVIVVVGQNKHPIFKSICQIYKVVWDDKYVNKIKVRRYRYIILKVFDANGFALGRLK